MADDAAGKGRHLGGKIKEEVGEVLGDRDIEREGRLDQVEGRAEQDQAKAEQEAREAAERRAAAERAKNQRNI